MTGPDTTDLCPEEFVTFAKTLAQRAGEISLDHFRVEVAVERKGDLSPVTAADRGAEAALRELVAARYPSHGVVGEEFGPHQEDAEFVWVFDPIDGTRAFVSGNPQFGNLIALTQGGRPLVGVINMPAQGDCWIGATGHGTQLIDAEGSRPAKTRACAKLSDAVLRAQLLPLTEPEGLDLLRPKVADSLLSGDCFSYGQLASGWLDLVAESGLYAFDFMALVPVVEGAGGVITDWQGQPLGMESDGRALASGDPALHQQALEVLAR
ncbi:MAG: inositol monophosphatase family protein [Pseudomonadota bacterium]